ncbi:MAG: polysaccharide biosynthesis tyrosine autokinase [Sedimentisphaerales bacterium]|nr:polysaccharide biosynthesis tyrosine autokinase [Sedimentisphaerales bacterium]
MTDNNTNENTNNSIVSYQNNNASSNSALAGNSRQYFDMHNMHEQHAKPGNLVPKLLDKWLLIFITFIVLASAIVPAVWLFTPQNNQAQLLIEVLPVISTLFSDPDDSAKTFAYDNFKNSQSTIILGEQVIQRTADLLRNKPLYISTPREETIKGRIRQVWTNKDISFLSKGNSDLYKTLLDMVKNKQITAVPDKYSSFIFLRVEGKNAYDCRQIAEAIKQSYQEIVLSQMDEEGDKKILALEEELKQITRDLERQQENIFQLTVKYGYADLGKRHEMIINRMEGIQEQLTLALSEKSKLENQVKKLESSIGLPAELPVQTEKSLMEEQSIYIKNDERLNKLNETIIAEEQNLLVAQQNLTPDNPQLSRKKNIIESLTQKAQERRTELVAEFARLKESEKDNRKTDIEDSRQTELEQTKAVFEEQVKYIEMLQQQLKNDNDEAIEIGRLDTLIKQKQNEEAQKQALKEDIQDKIMRLRIESKRPGRVNIDRPVSVFELESKRVKLAGGAAFASLAAGFALAFFLVKMDKSILYPEDIIDQAGLAMIGTTIDANSVKKDNVASYMTMDYQNIRANLKLLNNGAIPQVMVITSPEPAEGKTTLAINLAASLARSDHKVLLIDGDLRKPDIHRIINLPNRTIGLREVVCGVCLFEDAVFENFHPNLDILRACGSTNFDSIQMLSSEGIINFLRRMRDKYDHIVIDTSPVLAAPDALLFAQMADAVVLSSLAGKTTQPALKATLDRLTRLNVKILGNVLASVKDKPGYGYGHNYYDYRYGKDTKRQSKRNYDNIIIDRDSANS